ncbi:hypothetical protein EV702DRAFT_1197636 [Suillus placidus]|uniref:Uncharacterized protein n=1 Tax=Suillus placidus TaxID=48579 RepID=A0A9P7D1P6_9AGAM|nr:hypothetical protein EV702DRAFT_1197636 [Suillus placidus]
MPNNIPDLDRRAVVKDLAKRLRSLDHFLDAMNEIMKFSHLEDCELQRYGEKIIALTEANIISILVNSFTNALGNQGRVHNSQMGKEHVPYKSAYFKLLIWIRRRRLAFPADIDDRIGLLLSNMEHNIVLRTRGIDPRTQLGIEELLVIKKPRAACKSTIETAVPVATVLSAQESSTSPSEIPKEGQLGASFPSKAVCSRISYESPTL